MEVWTLVLIERFSQRVDLKDSSMPVYITGSEFDIDETTPSKRIQFGILHTIPAVLSRTLE